MKILEKLLEALGADELFQEERVPEINRTKYLEPTNRTYEISKKLAESDDEFSVDAMLDYAKKVFLEIHKAVYFKNAEPIRKLVSPVLFRIIEDIIVTEESLTVLLKKYT